MQGQINYPKQLGDNVIQTSHIQPDAVTRTKILDDAINIDKIADDAVGTDQLVDGCVTLAKIATGDIIRLVASQPASITASGSKGDMYIGTSEVYICTATNTWRKITLSTF